ncbi:acyltransferase family protein [Cesiribacter sp. SM1]|uniref:acyltransferase family protein n=1 Tax=Cesiribacter sp. SM1 TaxID=2861196 RepID=UPI001CD37380|nr:acyltransferase family protein [Cesiribacter sp. SM1]
MSTYRLSSLDIAKGMLIILVVVAHLPVALRDEVYYFHMPAFFIISGVFLPPAEKLSPAFIWKKVYSFVIPYIVYLLSIGITYQFLNGTLDTQSIIKLLLGGRALYGPLGPFWFISALFVSLLFYYFIEQFFRNRYYKKACILLFYIVAHVEAFVFSIDSLLFYIPLAADVALLIVPYLYVGRYLRSFMAKLEISTATALKHLLLFALLATAVLIAIHYQVVDYQLDMKYVGYNYPLFDVLIPVIFLFAIVSLSALLNGTMVGKLLELFGMASLVIMYLHLPLIYLVGRHNHLGVLILTGCLLPLLLYLVFRRNSFTSMIFLGK